MQKIFLSEEQLALCTMVGWTIEYAWGASPMPMGALFESSEAAEAHWLTLVGAPEDGDRRASSIEGGLIVARQLGFYNL